MLQSSTIKFLKDLQKNNNKPWFDAHRGQYEAARADFAGFIQKVIDTYGKKDTSIKHIIAKDCMFRINRDIRFSKNKTPYKNNFGASINKGGKQSISSGGYYFHFQPGNSFAGGGIWMPEKENLKKIRQEIDYNFKEFKKIIASKKFKDVYGDLSDAAEYKLSRIPKGYEADNPAAEYLKLKSFVAMISLKDADITSKDLLKKTITAFEALKPVLDFVDQALH
ncbi:MAG: DUF2461 domain-containing protein [Chitinophagaceae bacterium]